MGHKYILVLPVLVSVLILFLYILISNHTTSESKPVLAGSSEQLSRRKMLTVGERNAPQESTIENKKNKTSPNSSQKETEDHSLPIDGEFSPEDLPLDLHALSPPAWEVLTYTRKDRHVVTGMGTTDLESLAHQRYDLLTETGVESALTDLYEIFDLRNNEYYQTHWPEEQSIPFIDAVLDEILAKYPNNCSATLLKSCIAVEQDKSQEAIQVYGNTCESIKQNKTTIFFTEMVKTARYMLESDKLNSDDKNAIKRLTYDAGLPKTAPLALYMEGEPVDVMLNKYIRENKDPFDLSKSRQFFEGKVPEAVLDGQVTLDLRSLSKKEQREYCGYKLSALSMEKDARALIELSNNFEAAKVAPAFVKGARISAHICAGHMSQAVKEINEVIDNSNKYAEFPHLVTSSYFNLGVILYEQGLFAESREVFNKCKDALTGRKVEQMTKILRDPRMNN